MATRKPKAESAPDAEPVVDTLTRDLPFDLTPAANESAQSLVATKAGDVALPDLATMKPAEYVATIYQPFKAKFAQLCAEADLVAVDEADFQRLAERQNALPEDQRRPVSRLDLTTKDGMATAIRLRAAFRDDVRLAAEKTREARKAPLLAVGKELDNQSKPIKEAAAVYEDRFDAAIKAEEKRKADEKAEAERIERERVAKIRANIDTISAYTKDAISKSADDLRTLCTALAQVVITEADYAEFTAEAQQVLDATGAQLATLYREAKAREDEAARLAAEAEAQRLEAERLKAEREAQEKAAAELAAQQAEQKRAMEAVQQVQALGATTGNAFSLQQAIDAIRAIPDFKPPMGDMVKMAKDMAIPALEQRLEAATAAEEAAVLNLVTSTMQEEVEPEPVRAEPLNMTVPDHPHDYAPIDWDAPAPAPAPQPAFAEPVSDITKVFAGAEQRPGLRLPESWTAEDEAVTDVEIIVFVAERFGWDILDTIERLKRIDFEAAREAA